MRMNVSFFFSPNCLPQNSTMNPQRGADSSSTWRIHCENIAKLLRMVIVELWFSYNSKYARRSLVARGGRFHS